MPCRSARRHEACHSGEIVVTTSIDNGVPLCYTHHHYVHEGRRTITWNPNTGVTTLTGPAGQTIESHTHIPMPAAC